LFRFYGLERLRSGREGRGEVSIRVDSSGSSSVRIAFADLVELENEIEGVSRCECGYRDPKGEERRRTDPINLWNGSAPGQHEQHVSELDPGDLFTRSTLLSGREEGNKVVQSLMGESDICEKEKTGGKLSSHDQIGDERARRSRGRRDGRTCFR